MSLPRKRHQRTPGDRFKGDPQTFFICFESALVNTTKKWNLKHHLDKDAPPVIQPATTLK